MKEIKFRAWDKDVSKMIPFEEIGAEGYSHGGLSLAQHLEPDDLLILMQYTGLKDKNGKEIYESDYLGDHCVFWGSGKYILQNISTGDIMDCNENTTYNKEVTGNRYENPREHKAMETDL